MIKIQIIASGSSGNCYKISDGDQDLMIECGINIKSIKKALNFNLSSIKCCIISHSHTDHCLSIEKVSSSGVDVFASRHTLKPIEKTCTSFHRLHYMHYMQVIDIGNYKILPFPLVHDVPCTGFLITCGSAKILYISDTAEINYKFSELTHIMIECNHDYNILTDSICSGKINFQLGHRITQNHLSLKYVKSFLKAQDLSKVEKIYLLHISKNNGDREQFKSEIEQLTGKEVII